MRHHPIHERNAMFKRILVPVDGSDTSNQALAAALQLAVQASAQLRVVHSLDELAYLTGFEASSNVLTLAREYGRKILDDALAQAKAAGVAADSELLEGMGHRLADNVADAARRWNADLVVVGTHGRGGIGRALLGSGAEQVIRSAPVPVLSIRSKPAKAD
jgi:nucleotide-binding universal stress UspA family protein